MTYKAEEILSDAMHCNSSLLVLDSSYYKTPKDHYKRDNAQNRNMAYLIATIQLKILETIAAHK